MPYVDLKSLPEYIKKYSPKIQSMWRKTFNSSYERAIKKGKTPKEAESDAFQIASGVIRKRIEQHSRYGYDNRFSLALDKFLGNIR